MANASCSLLRFSKTRWTVSSLLSNSPLSTSPPPTGLSADQPNERLFLCQENVIITWEPAVLDISYPSSRSAGLSAPFHQKNTLITAGWRTQLTLTEWWRWKKTGERIPSGCRHITFLPHFFSLDIKDKPWKCCLFKANQPLLKDEPRLRCNATWHIGWSAVLWKAWIEPLEESSF